MGQGAGQGGPGGRGQGTMGKAGHPRGTSQWPSATGTH
jgi:hypothetical protein